VTMLASGINPKARPLPRLPADRHLMPARNPIFTHKVRNSRPQTPTQLDRTLTQSP